LTVSPQMLSPNPPTPAPVLASSEEIISENCYVQREPVADSRGQVHLHVEVLCD
jgi:hypothetical protein